MHVAVARDLCDHRRGGDRGAARVAVDDRPVLHGAALAEREAVGQARRPGHRHPFEGARECLEVGDVQAPRVDSADAADRDRDLRSRPDHHRVEGLALLGGALLGVVEVAEGAAIAHAEALVIEQNAGGHQRPGERPAAGLVGAGDEPAAELAVELEQLRGPAAAALGGLDGGGRRLRGARGSRCGPAASR